MVELGVVQSKIVLDISHSCSSRWSMRNTSTDFSTCTQTLTSAKRGLSHDQSSRSQNWRAILSLIALGMALYSCYL